MDKQQNNTTSGSAVFGDLKVSDPMPLEQFLSLPQAPRSPAVVAALKAWSGAVPSLLGWVRLQAVAEAAVRCARQRA